MSSADSGKNFDLRCLVREQLIAYLQKNHPESLPRVRAELGQAGIAGDDAHLRNLSRAHGREQAPP